MDRIEYTLIIESDSVSLEDAVNESISNGWEPSGGVCYVTSQNEHTNDSWVQAMIRRR